VRGVEGFLANHTQRVAVHPDAERWKALVTEWHRRWGTSLVSTADLWDLIQAEPSLAERFYEVLGEGTPNGQKIRLGRALDRYALRVFDEWRIVRSTARTAGKTVLWRLRLASEPVEGDEPSDDGNPAVITPQLLTTDS
jgi:hypothetical protein